MTFLLSIYFIYLFVGIYVIPHYFVKSKFENYGTFMQQFCTHPARFKKRSTHDAS